MNAFINNLVFGWAVPFLILLALFVPLELVFQKNRQSIFRREWGTDLAFMLGQYLLWTAPVVGLLVVLKNQVAELPLELIQERVRTLPVWLQITLVVFISDLCIYWGHRLSHRLPFLWRFHKVHHTSETLDWMAAYREHPVDNLFTRTVENAPVFLLGFPLEFIAGIVAFRGVWGLVIHSNTVLPLGPFKWILGSPSIHHWHHARWHSGCNYANLMPLMDLIFGTYHCPEKKPLSYGVKEIVPHGYVQQLYYPLTPSGLTGPNKEESPINDEFEGLTSI
jgi:sterol desaturase/sphingolipid hydroxylase (fatty acid hydroxylase superfamily)